MNLGYNDGLINLKTSYVIVQPEEATTDYGALLFKNILCYCSTSSLLTVIMVSYYLKTSYVIVQQ